MNDKWEIIRGITTVSSTNKMNIDENNGKIKQWQNKNNNTVQLAFKTLPKREAQMSKNVPR